MPEREYDIGACDVFFKAPGEANEKDLGHTSGGVTLSVTYETTEIEVDQLLDAVDERITKRTITVTTPLAEFTLENLQRAFPGSIIVTDATDPTKKKLVIPSLSGKSARDYAGALRLHPVTSDGPDDHRKDFNFPMAAPVGGELSIAFTKADLKTIGIQFKAYPDADGNSLIVGDPTAEA